MYSTNNLKTIGKEENIVNKKYDPKVDNVFTRTNMIMEKIRAVEKEIAEEPITKKVRTNWGLLFYMLDEINRLLGLVADDTKG